jgi:hypothetical protein
LLWGGSALATTKYSLAKSCLADSQQENGKSELKVPTCQLEGKLPKDYVSSILTVSAREIERERMWYKRPREAIKRG